jgi:hypothetical protein
MITVNDIENSGFEYTFEIKEVKTTTAAGLSDVIYGTQWELIGTFQECQACGESHQGKFSGATPLRIPDSFEPGSFKKLNEIKESDVEKWVSDILFYDRHPFDVISQQIEDVHKQDLAGDELPWSLSIT